MKFYSLFIPKTYRLKPILVSLPYNRILVSGPLVKWHSGSSVRAPARSPGQEIRGPLPNAECLPPAAGVGPDHLYNTNRIISQGNWFFYCPSFNVNLKDTQSASNMLKLLKKP
ncbi:uncharacterized protein LOC108088273 [Drosophila ficusphila]|uniref:uncharacterized protein LOC108088273 n=1 Tax=Drosophila ficusphila TaxID=30025 RepID=UPI0007E7997B|nr:uncharacterized protein LOC108088273 [Drosophila ficusphila]